MAGYTIGWSSALGSLGGAAIAAPGAGLPPSNQITPPAFVAARPTQTSVAIENLVALNVSAAESRIELNLGSRIDALGDKMREALIAITQVGEKYKTLETKVDGKAGIWTVWGAAGAILVGVVAAMGLGVAIYGNALSASGAFADRVLDAKENARAQSQSTDAINAKLNEILKAQSDARKPTESPRAEPRK
jgi:hypothetical protein